MAKETADRQSAIKEMSHRFGVSEGAVETLIRAVQNGGGRGAQFNHPDLGGMGQWSRGGMVMIGDMFNDGLKDRVAKLCEEIAGHVQDGTLAAEARGGSGTARSSPWWPKELGTPASTGAQNSMRYAFFPEIRRLVIERDGRTAVYETGEHRLSGFSQQQSTGQSVAFSSQDGPVHIEELREVNDPGTADYNAPGRCPPVDKNSATMPTEASERDYYADLERLHDLHNKGILTDEEFATKKKELLARI